MTDDAWSPGAIAEYVQQELLDGDGPANSTEASSDQELAPGIWDGKNGRFGAMEHRMGHSPEDR